MTVFERKKWVQEALVDLNQKDIQNLFSYLPMEKIIIKKKPIAGLIMMKVIDTFETEFYMGEVLVSEAEVVFHNQPGYGMILGEDLDKALLLASVDAILSSENNLDGSLSPFFQKLDHTIMRYKEERQTQEKIVMQTKVNFKTF
jgi:phosphonate C-P lyase system protein PhnG